MGLDKRTRSDNEEERERERSPMLLGFGGFCLQENV